MSHDLYRGLGPRPPPPPLSLSLRLQLSLALAAMMATTTSTPHGTASPMMGLNTTITEHEFRFPRRPVESGGASMAPSAQHHTNLSLDFSSDHFHHDFSDMSSFHNGGAPPLTASAAPTNLSAGRLGLDVDSLYRTAQDRLLRDEVFADLRKGSSRESDATPSSPEEMQKQDPLATEIWRFFSKTKQLLPNQERMENLTWRMMHVKLKSVQPQRLQPYVLVSFCRLLSSFPSSSSFAQQGVMILTTSPGQQASPRLPLPMRRAALPSFGSRLSRASFVRTTRTATASLVSGWIL